MATRNTGREQELKASTEAAREALDKLLEAKRHFRHAAEKAGLDAKDEAVEKLDKGRAKVDELGNEASLYMIEKPVQTLGIAALGGFVLSHLLSRR